QHRERARAYNPAVDPRPRRRGHRMRRRSVVIAGLAALLLAPERSTAQQATAKIPRVGIIEPAENAATPIFEAFRQGLRELGYVEGRNIILEFRFTHGDYAPIQRLAQELVNLPVDVIVTDGGLAVARAAVGASRTTPIVMGAGGDPVAASLVASLARPGGNLTGFTLMSNELHAKRVDL